MITFAALSKQMYSTFESRRTPQALPCSPCVRPIWDDMSINETRNTSAGTDLSASDDAEFAGRCSLASDRADSHRDGLGDGGRSRVPVTDLVRNDLNDGHARVVLVTLRERVRH
jgi:hypothetical protein